VIYGPVYKLYKNAKFKIHLNGTCGDAYNSIFDAILNYELWQRNYATLLSYSQPAVPLHAPPHKHQHYKTTQLKQFGSPYNRIQSKLLLSYS
jgi:hypothetical protein